MITYRNKLDVTPGGVPLRIDLSQYDDDFTLIFDLFSEDGTFTVESGTTVTIRGTKRDGNGYSVDATLDGTAVTVAGDKQLTAVAGESRYELTLWKDDKELSTSNFIIKVERAALDMDTVQSVSKIRELINSLDRADEIIAAAETVDDAIANLETTLQTLHDETLQARDDAQAAALEAAEQAVEDVLDIWQDLSGSLQEQIEDANTMFDQIEEDVTAVNQKAELIVNLTTDAKDIATQALAKANNVENEAAEFSNRVDQLNTLVRELRLRLEGKLDDLYLENGLLYGTAEGEVIVGPLGPFAGGGGGGGGGGDTNHAVLTVTNLTGWLSKTIAASSKCEVKISWSSVEDEMPTGDGTVRITVNNVVKATPQVQQGEVTLDLAKYCSNGANVCKVQVSDIYGNSRTINFSITVTPLSISSSFDTSTPYSGAIPFPYTPVGSVLKTVHFIVDGTEVGTQDTSVSNRQMTYTIPAQSHGAHTLRVYFDAEINDEIVTSNEIYFEFMSIEPLNTAVIITSQFNLTAVDQFSSIVIPWRVYNPTSDQTEVRLYINDGLVSTQTVDRTEQNFTYRASTAGNAKFTISAGNSIKEINFVVNEVEINVEAETEDLALYLNAQGRSNNETTRDIWVYDDIQAQFSNFNWRLDGWQTDSDGINVLRLVDDARLTIPYKIFENDFKATGKTIEIEFATRQVADYGATILSCFADNIGLKITPQSVEFRGAQNNLSTLYKDNEHLRLSIVVEKQTENRLILIYINGIMSRAIQYASGERFSQLSPVSISIGSNDCGIDIYNIRIYDNSLNRQQVLENWIADTQIGEVMLERYQHNQVYNSSGEVTVATLPPDLPYFILEAVELPQYKDDKKIISGSFVYPGNPSRSFTFEGCQINVQGTSSAIYYRKNYDMQFKGGFNTNVGNVATYPLRPGSIPFNRFVLKADVASSEGANNTELTMFYNDSCPYRTPAMQANEKVRYGIEGYPIAVFWYNPDTQETTFLGKYNFNLPKRAAAPYGYSGNLESWEWQRNNSSNVKFQDDDFTTMAYDALTQTSYPAWYDDFEARFPSDEWRDYSQLKEFISWVKSTNREDATNAALPEEVTYILPSSATIAPYQATDSSFTVVDEMIEGVATGRKIVTFTKDTAAYRLSKFRAEADDYMEIDSALFYYLFTELFLMIDSRAKNMFVGFDGSEIE